MRTWVTAVVLVVATAASLAAQSAEVKVVVSVREGSRHVTGLTAGDFALMDNDTAQVVQLGEFGAQPLDLTLVVDTKTSAANVADRLARDVQQIGRTLRAGDRLRVIRVDTFAHELRPMAAMAAQPIAVPVWSRSGLSSLHDALIAALVRPRPADRLQLVIAVTDGLDTMSVNSADRLREVAARSGALLQIVTVRSPGGSNAGFVSMRPRFRDANPLILTEAAEQTGGELRPPALFGDTDLAGAVARVLNDARQSYVLTFTPQHVERGGWHELSVSVAKAPNATVRARRGYYE